MKITNILLIGLLIGLISACGSSTGTKQEPVKTNEKTTTSETAKSPEKTSSSTTTKHESPTAAITSFVAAIKAKDDAGARGALSKASVKAFELTAKNLGKSFYEVLIMEDEEEVKNLPEMRNEKINGDKATLEVKDKNSDKWEKVPFVKEDGSWKLAFFSEEELKEMEKEMS